MKRQQLIEIRKESVNEFKEEMTRLGIKRKQLQDLVAGFEDGMTTITHAFVSKGILIIEKE